MPQPSPSLWIAVVALLVLLVLSHHHQFPLAIQTANAAAVPVIPQPQDSASNQQPPDSSQQQLAQSAISWPPVTSLAAANANFDQLRPGCFPIPANSASCTGFKGLLIHANFTMFLEHAIFGSYPPGVNLSITSARLGSIVPGAFQLPNANQTEREVLLNTVNGDRFDQAFALAFTTNAPTLLNHVLPTCPPALINPSNPSTFPSYFNTTMCALLTSFWSPVCYSSRIPSGALGTPTSAVRTTNSSTPTIVPLPTGTPRPPPVPRPMCPSSANEFAQSATRLASLCASAKIRGDAHLHQANAPPPPTSTPDAPANLDQFPKLAAWIAAATTRIQVPSAVMDMPADPGCIRGVPGGHLVSVDVVSTGDPAYDNRKAQGPGWWLVSGVLVGVGVGAAGIGAAVVMGVSWKKKHSRRSKSVADEARGRRAPSGLGGHDRDAEAGEVRRRRGSASVDSVVETGMPRLSQIKSHEQGKDTAVTALAVEGQDGGTGGRATSVRSANLSFRSVEDFLGNGTDLPPVPEVGPITTTSGGKKCTTRASSGSPSLIVHVNGTSPGNNVNARDLSPPRTPSSSTVPPDGVTHSPLKRAGKHLSNLWRRWSMPAGMQASTAASTARVNPEQHAVARRQQQSTATAEVKAVAMRQTRSRSPVLATRTAPTFSTSATLPRRPTTSPSPLSSNAPRRGSWAPPGIGSGQAEAAQAIPRPASVQVVHMQQPMDAVSMVPMPHYMAAPLPHVPSTPHHEIFYQLQEPSHQLQLSYEQQLQYQQYQVEYDTRPMTWAGPPPSPTAVVYPVYFVPTIPIASPLQETQYLQQQQLYHYPQVQQPSSISPEPQSQPKTNTPLVTRPIPSQTILTDIVRTSTTIPTPSTRTTKEGGTQQTALAPPTTSDYTSPSHTLHHPVNQTNDDHERASICSAADESHIPDHYLPLINSVHVAVAHFLPRLDDELRVIRGDRIRIEWAWSDGWAYGVNEESMDEGTFPLAVFSDVASPIAVREEDTSLPPTPTTSNPTRPNSVVVTAAASAALVQSKSYTAASSTTDLIAHPRTATVIAPPATPSSTFASLDGPLSDDKDVDRDFDARSIASTRTVSLYASGSGAASLRSLLMTHPPTSMSPSPAASPARPGTWMVSGSAARASVAVRPRSGSHMDMLRGQLEEFAMPTEGVVVAGRLPHPEPEKPEPAPEPVLDREAIAHSVEAQGEQESGGESGGSSRATTLDGHDDSDEERTGPASVPTSNGRPLSTASTASTATIQPASKRASRISIYHDASCEIGNLAACPAIHTDPGSGTNVTALVTLERDDDLMSSASDELPVVRLKDVDVGGVQDSSVCGGSSSATVVGTVMSGSTSAVPKSWRSSMVLDSVDEAVEQR
ncbi:hypothetical protein BCR44DRAFT_55635 [Catenaria anguillulae PL171]|uniref:SH3 domain-containing protein n=1 Tax=Catenaria anguillulae PL171 TaxID=765915 RepID=A0A1Y2HLY8_9FUNG|nr:hypothetical protein BCR44DRAFT_55635 [Catenaria anguillulae PL171]